MDIAAKKRLRDFAVQMRALLEKKCANLGIPDSSEQAWRWALHFAVQESMAMRGIAGELPDFFAFAQCQISFPDSLLPLCRQLLGEGEGDFIAPDALAWFYQYWNDTERQAIAERLGFDTKVSSADVAPATQVYTEEYMAEYLLQNSLGALWMASRPQSALADHWQYYVREQNQVSHSVRQPSTLSVLDPACGSGNLLLVAFDLLFNMYKEAEEEDNERVCAAIINQNLYGMDIDPQAVEVARAVLWLRAKEKAPAINTAAVNGLCEHILHTPYAGEEAELGSLLRLSVGEKNLPMFASLLSRTYDVVVTNPPYLDKRDYSKVVGDYLKKHYSKGAGNLYTAFLLRCLELADHYVGMVTPQTFLYIRHYTKLRQTIFNSSYIRNLAHLGLGAFAGVVVDVALFVLEKRISGHSELGVYFKLLEAADKQKALAESIRALNEGAQDRRVFVRSLTSATALDGAPVIYWLGAETLQVLKSSRTLGDIADVVLGMKTSDNRRFVRYWWELSTGNNGQDWVPYEKEASGYRYQRNAAHYVRWTEDALDYYKNHYSAQLPNARYWFCPGIVYGLISSKAFTAKILPPGHMTDMAASCIYPREDKLNFYLLALLNSKIYQWLLKCFNPTVNYQPVDVKRLPVPEISPTEEMHLGHLGEIAAIAAGALREMEITDRAYHYQPHSLLPIGEKLANYICGIWKSSLLYLLATDGVDASIADVLHLPEEEYEGIMEEMGLPASTFPALVGYEAFPKDFPAIVRKKPNAQVIIGEREVIFLKEKLKQLYSEGPSPGQLPEAFFEELAIALQLHPVSIYNLIWEGIGSAGWTCKLEKRLVEDFFSASVLRLMGHSWPGEIRDGKEELKLKTVAVSRKGDDACIYELLLAFLAAEGIDSLAAERDFFRVLGVSLNDWLENSFFKRHLSQFKKRPVIWQITNPSRVNGEGDYFIHCRNAQHVLAGKLDKRLPGYQADPELGVRVNIAPLQKAGVLSADVLSERELRLALKAHEEWARGKNDYLL